MLARILGYVDVPRFVAPHELELALTLEYQQNYSAFVLGAWSNCVLWNGSGEAGDCDLHEYDRGGKPTANLSHLPGLRALLEGCFEPERMKWARLFRQDRGVLLPHIDYVGMRDGFVRLHIPLQTRPGAVHSEENEVYHMRQGEIWYLDATRTHSAGNFSGAPRLTLCVDFIPGVAPESLVRASFREAASERGPEMVPRSALSPVDRRALEPLSEWLREGRTNEVMEKLIRTHFEHEISASAVYEWLDDLAAATGSPPISERAREIRELALGKAAS